MIPFTKMHGIGNDFVMVNAFRHPLDEAAVPGLARAICDRRFGVGSDGLILALPGKHTALAMRMFNPDGSESEMCGNGVRCFAGFAHEEGLTDDSEIPVETGAGLLMLTRLEDGQIRVDMGTARLTRGEIGMTGSADETFIDQPLAGPAGDLRGTAVSMGNPHIVFFTENVASIPLEDWGPQLEVHPLFPARVNVHFVEIIHRGHIRQRTWERGAGATLACGTGACACAVASFLNGRTDRHVAVDLPGGRLTIDYHESGRVDMTGPAATVYRGIWDR